MTFKSWSIRKKFAGLLSTLSLHRRKALLLLPMGMVVFLGVWLFQAPAIADLSEENREQVPVLLSQWDKGEVIVLLRHLERCDRGDAPCLAGTSGITARSVAGGDALGDDFYQLGLQKSDIYNSPLTRTAQTENLVFDDLGADRKWLYQCKENMLDDAVQSKKPGRNLILVTHSSCISRFEAALGYASNTPDYGTALFFSNDPVSRKLQALGFLHKEDWKRALGI
ncbi:MAG: histidine phosphatase family protein [Pseudomonas sp.]